MGYPIVAEMPPLSEEYPQLLLQVVIIGGNGVFELVYLSDLVDSSDAFGVMVEGKIHIGVIEQAPEVI